jgi:hypothetical protein
MPEDAKPSVTGETNGQPDPDLTLLSDDDLDREIFFAEAFGPDIAPSRLPAVVAEKVLTDVERSGYGTDDEERWTPVFDVEDVLILAREVLAYEQEINTYEAHREHI